MSINNPAAYSLIGDYFPQNKRGTANAIFNSAIYVGQGVSALNILILQNEGWRNDFRDMGLAGTFVGLVSLYFLYEPKRNQEGYLINKIDDSELEQI